MTLLSINPRPFIHQEFSSRDIPVEAKSSSSDDLSTPDELSRSDTHSPETILQEEIAEEAILPGSPKLHLAKKVSEHTIRSLKRDAKTLLEKFDADEQRRGVPPHLIEAVKHKELKKIKALRAFALDFSQYCSFEKSDCSFLHLVSIQNLIHLLIEKKQTKGKIDLPEFQTIFSEHFEKIPFFLVATIHFLHDKGVFEEGDYAAILSCVSEMQEQSKTKIASMLAVSPHCFDETLEQHQISPVFVERALHSIDPSTIEIEKLQSMAPSLREVVLPYLLYELAHVTTVHIDSPNAPKVFSKIVTDVLSLQKCGLGSAGTRAFILSKLDSTHIAHRGDRICDFLMKKEIPLDHFTRADISDSDAKIWKSLLSSERLIQLYKKAMSSPKATVVEYFDSNNCIYMRVRDNEIVVKLGIRTGIGAQKTAWKVIRLGPTPKTYTLLLPNDPSQQEDLVTEFTMMEKLKHPYIASARKLTLTEFPWTSPVDAYGTCPRISIKAPFYERGNVRRLVQKLPQKNSDVLERVRIVCDIAEALKHIHSFQEGGTPSKLAHMDVTPANIFLSNSQGRLMGFLGNINPLREGEDSLHTTSCYAAPEAGKRLLFTLKGKMKSRSVEASQTSDIWSLGITLYQLLYGKETPEGSLKGSASLEIDYKAFKKSVSKKFRETSHDQAYKAVNKIISLMLKTKSSKRPTAQKLVPMLEKTIQRIWELC
jgi:serine/threonine protein kinase